MTQKIAYDRNLPTGYRVARFIGKLQDLLADGRRLKGELDATSYGSDWHTLALTLGLPDPAVVSDTQAQDLWTIVSTIMSTIDVPQTAASSRLDQG